MIFDIPYHHRKCEELAFKKNIRITHLVGDIWWLVGERRNKILRSYDTNTTKNVFRIFLLNIDHTGSKIIFIYIGMWFKK